MTTLFYCPICKRDVTRIWQVEIEPGVWEEKKRLLASDCRVRDYDRCLQAIFIPHEEAA